MTTPQQRSLRQRRAANMARLGLAMPPAPTGGGPGTELRRLLHLMGIEPRGPHCKCNEHAAEMDRRGPDWCLQNLDTILDWLEAEARTRPLLGMIFSRMAARHLVLLAIKRARQH